MQIDFKPRKLNDQGLSLIELLIAIAILSIVVVVFYEGFILSAKVNSKAKVQHQATSLAQDIMEAFKSQDMDDLMMQFEYPAGSYVVGADTISYRNFELLPDLINADAFSDVSNIGNYIGSFAELSVDDEGNALTSYIKDLTTVYDEKTGKYVQKGTYVNTKDGKYYLYLQDLVMEKRHFDALITLNGRPYMAAEEEDETDPAIKIPNDEFTGKEYNEREVVQIPNMDAQYDVITSNSMVFDKEAEAQFQAMSTKIPDFDVSRMSREIYIEIEENSNIIGFLEQKVSVAYNYTYSVDSNPAHDIPLSIHKDYPFDNTMEKETNLRNVYLFYDPRKDYKQDKIKIVRAFYPSELRNDLDVYIVKLLPSDYDSVGTSWDDQYHPILEVEERQRLISGSVTYPEPSIKLHTNIGYYMKKDLASDTFLKMSNCQMTYDGISLGFLYNGVPNTDPETALAITSLTNKASLDRIFDIEVEVFLHDDEGGVRSYDDFKGLHDANEAKADVKGTIRN